MRNKLSTFLTEPIKEGIKKNKILMFDAHNLVYRTLFVAANEFKKRKNDFLLGNENNQWLDKDFYAYWKHLVLSSLLYNISDRKPNKIIFAIEGMGNWRKEIYKDYKAKRKDARDKSIIDFDTFFPILEHFINNLGRMFSNIYVLRVDNSEADDVIAVLTELFVQNKNNEIELISTDRDFIQLQIYKNFRQFNPIKREYIKSINPKKDLEVKILTGDSSDNISGIQYGIGKKTAEKLLNGGVFKKKSLEQLLEDEEIKKAFIRNRMLIDFKYIPKEVKERIIKAYNDYEIKDIDGNEVWQWLLREKLNKLSDDWQQFLATIKQLG